jgi:alanine racemase
MRIWCDISTSKYIQFWQALRPTLRPGAQIMAVVKANGYGLGAAPLALAAQKANVIDWTAVATVPEAEALRSSGIHLPILLLSEPAIEELDLALSQALQFVVYTPTFIQLLAEYAHRHQQIVSVHLKVNTGMNRLGCTPEDTGALVRLIETSPYLHLKGIMSHMACSDIHDHPLNMIQYNQFDTIITSLSLPQTVIPHIANSAATRLFPDTHMGMVRVGIDSFSSIITLRSRVINILKVGPGDTISYGAHAKITKETRIATISAGYADGIPRCFSGDVIINGNRHQSIGPICMDMFMVDIGNHHLLIGDTVTLIGDEYDEKITLDEYAKNSQRITYEAITGLSPRVFRRWV